MRRPPRADERHKFTRLSRVKFQALPIDARGSTTPSLCESLL